MPITIRELVIRTIITDPDERGGNGGEAPDEPASPMEPADIDGLVQECVTQVMERLRERNER